MYLECECGRGDYDDERYRSCYECYKERRTQYDSCIYCGRWHSPKFPLCFNCRAKGRREEAARDLKLDILIRDNFTCRDCGASEPLEIDHIKPCRHGGGAAPWNLEVLCRICNQEKFDTWFTGCEWDNTRIELIHTYLTFGWNLLGAQEQQQLIDDADTYHTNNENPFRHHIHYKESKGTTLPLPDWAIKMADAHE